MSAEYVLSEGNRQVILCERGIRTFEDSTRNTLDLSIVPNVQGQSHLPIIVDPSHATGRPDLIPAMARAAVAAGADGVHVEVHSCPEQALSDGPQALLPAQFDRLMDEIRPLAELLGKSIDACKGEPARMRTLLIAGNWKMNPATRAEAVALAEAVKAGVGTATNVRVALCPPATCSSRRSTGPGGDADRPGRSEHALGAARGVHRRDLGAMLVDAGCTHVILGHSERRHGLGETDAAGERQAHGRARRRADPDRLHGRDQGRAAGRPDRDRCLLEQLTGSLAGLSPEQMAGTVLAYEPVWAIGTGLTATPEQAQAAHRFIRGWLAEQFGEATAARVVVQYGGSVKPDNAAELCWPAPTSTAPWSAAPA